MLCWNHNTTSMMMPTTELPHDWVVLRTQTSRAHVPGNYIIPSIHVYIYILCTDHTSGYKVHRLTRGISTKHTPSQIQSTPHSEDTYPLYKARTPSSCDILTRACIIPRYLEDRHSSSIRWPCTCNLVFVVSKGKVPGGGDIYNHHTKYYALVYSLPTHAILPTSAVKEAIPPKINGFSVLILFCSCCSRETTQKFQKSCSLASYSP